MQQPFGTQVAESIPFNDPAFISTDSLNATKEIDFREVTKEPTGFERSDRADSTLSYNEATRTFSITAKAPYTFFTYYIRGRKYELSSASVQWGDSEGIWFFHFAGDTLVATQTPWSFESPIAFVFIMYWDATNKLVIYDGDERHGVSMDWATHQRLHSKDGLVVLPRQLIAGDYILNGNGTLNSHAQLSLTNGSVLDEDLRFDIVNSDTPTNAFEQKLSPILNIPMYYQNGATGTWRKLSQTEYPIAWQSGNRTRYNYYDEATMQWSLQTVTNEWYVATWIFATNNINEPIIGIVGQMQYIEPLEADAEEQLARVNLTGLPFQEFSLIYRCLFRTSNLFTNTPKTILVNITGTAVPNNLAQAISNRKLTSQTTYTTSSLTDVQIPDFSLIPDAGTYAIFYSAQQIIGSNNAIGSATIYIDGIAIDDSLRQSQGTGSNYSSQMNIVTVGAFNGSQTANVRVRITSGTFTTNARTLVLIRLGPA